MLSTHRSTRFFRKASENTASQLAPPVPVLLCVIFTSILDRARLCALVVHFPFAYGVTLLLAARPS